MVARSAGKRGYGEKRKVKYWARLGCWFSPCYGPFSLGARFETYETFIYLNFDFWEGRGKPRILNQWIRGHDCIESCQNSHVNTSLRISPLVAGDKKHLQNDHVVKRDLQYMLLDGDLV
jgi:hypothetical protein